MCISLKPHSVDLELMGERVASLEYPLVSDCWFHTHTHIHTHTLHHVIHPPSIMLHTHTHPPSCYTPHTHPPSIMLQYLSAECSQSSLNEFRESLENRARVRIQLIDDLKKKRKPSFSGQSIIIESDYFCTSFSVLQKIM